MIRPVEAGRHQVTEAWLLTDRDRTGGDDAGQLYFELDCAVGVEIPEKAVLVVADRGKARDDKATRAPSCKWDSATQTATA